MRRSNRCSVCKALLKGTEIKVCGSCEVVRVAISTGMSYGKVQGLRHEKELAILGNRVITPEEREEARRQELLAKGYKVCEYCEELFLPKPARARFCCPECRMAFAKLVKRYEK